MGGFMQQILNILLNKKRRYIKFDITRCISKNQESCSFLIVMEMVILLLCFQDLKHTYVLYPYICSRLENFGPHVGGPDCCTVYAENESSKQKVTSQYRARARTLEL